MSNPPNVYTTPAIWRLWEEVSSAIGYRVKLGGVYANKSGYHNTRKANKAKWPSNYSIQLDLDKQGPDNKAAAIDLTFSSVTDMKKYTKRLADAFDARDPRLASVKEFYGTLDGAEVYGLGKKSRTGAPYGTSADDSHLWHLHISFFRADVESWDRVKGVGEVLTGMALSGGVASKPTTERNGMNYPVYGDDSDAVETYQRMFEALGYELNGGHDGKYGPSVRDTVKAYCKKYGNDTYHGEKITAWIHLQLMTDYNAVVLAGKVKGPKGDKGEAGKDGKDGVLTLPESFTGTITLTESK